MGGTPPFPRYKKKIIKKKKTLKKELSRYLGDPILNSHSHGDPSDNNVTLVRNIEIVANAYCVIMHYFHYISGNPMSAFLYGLSLNYCMTTALTGPGKKGVGICWGVENMEEALKQQGFTEITFCPNEQNHSQLTNLLDPEISYCTMFTKK